MAIKRFTVDINGVVDPGSVCSNPTITYTLPENLAVVCDNGDSIDIEINTDTAGPHCLTFIIDCSESCSACGQIVVRKCFCANVDDCPDCGICTDNVCVSRCAAGQVCDNDTCVDCSEAVPCPCNQICTQGKCVCPADRPLKRVDGCCVECIDGQPLGPCKVCINGTIVTLNCPNGHCDPVTGNCQECLNNSHCTEVNECCNIFGQCDCCPGYIRDPQTGQCIPQPPCTDAQDCIDQYGKCYYCTADGCAPIVCPAGFVCDPGTGNCVPECDGVCPEGYGCINGICVPCNQLSCTGGAGLQCQFADNCQCVGNTCEYVDCHIDNVSAEWVQTAGTPGQVVPGTGQPALTGTTSITAGGIVSLQAPHNGNYREHTFNLGVSNGTTGQWVLHNTPTDSVSLGSGTSVSFDLSDTQGPNLVGFVVDFTENGTGRTARWTFWRTPTAPLTEPNVWFYTFSAQGVPPQTTGGTAGSLQLCLTNGNFQPTSVTNVVTTGSISVAFFPTGGNCLTAIVSGCGTWNGDIVAMCGGQTVTIPAPELNIPLDTCCDPTDPNCGVGFGEPCTGLAVQNIDLVALPTYGTGAGGDGEFLVIADWTSAGLSFGDLFWLNPSAGCWSTPDNPDVSNDDLVIVTSGGQSPFGPSVSALSRVVTLGNGGCIALGETCTLRISGCRRLEGRLCVDECDVFSVDIIELGSNMYAAVPSLADEVVTYEWVYPGLLATSNQTVTITPVGGTSTLIVTARYGSPVKCTESDTLTLNTFIAGCTAPTACNYDPTANINDNSCVYVAAPTYSCVEGGFAPGLVTAGTATVVYKIGSTTITPGTVSALLAPGTYTVDVYINGIQECSRSLTVPQCYRCSAGDCIIAPLADNWGPYTTNDCGGACDCDIEIIVQENACSNGGRSWTLRASGGSGSYTIRVDRFGGANVLPLQTLTSAGSVTTPILCTGVYVITVTDNVTGGCGESETRSVTCPCDPGSALALTGGAYNCDTNQLEFTPTPGQCSETVTVKLLTAGGTQVALATYPAATLTSAPGPRFISIGTYPGDGTYTLQIVDNWGCTRNYELILNCTGTLAPCPISAVDLTYSDDAIDVDFTVTFTLTEAGGNYTVRLFETTGGGPTSCVGAVPAAQIGATASVVGVAGVNVVNFFDAVTVPGTGTCYAATVQRLGTGYGSCNQTDTVLVVPTGAPPSCTMAITNTSYNTTTGNLLVSWDSENGSGNSVVEINVYAGATCTGTPTLITQTFPSADGVNVPFSVPQLSGSAQCVTVTVYDSSFPSCTDTVEDIAIAACTCQVVITDTTVISSAPEEVFIEFTTRCTSGDIDFVISGDATGSATYNNGSEDGTVGSHNITIPLTGYPSTGGFINITATDAVTGSCTDTESNVVLPENCEGCAQAVTFLATSGETLLELRDRNGNAILLGSYNMSTGEAAIETDTQAGLVGEGANFCTGDTPVDFMAGRSGMGIVQDNSSTVDMDYGLVNSGTFGNQTSWFGDCGCDTGRLCDYTVTIAVGAADTFIDFWYANMNVGGGYGSSTRMTGLSQSPSGSFLANVETQIMGALTTAFGCSYTVGAVDATYNSGTDELTIAITQTNAGLGPLTLGNGSTSQTVMESYLQSNCTDASS